MLVKIGHRGAAGHAPENTLKSFSKAIELNADVIELDVYLCKSKELVVIHDDKVDRTTNGKGYVEEKTLEDLKSLDAGSGEKIPLLSEVLELVNRKVKVNIELKGTGTAKPVSELIHHYVKNKAWSYDDFIISSFNHYELLEFNKLNPEVKIGVLITGIPVGFGEFAQKLNAYSVNPCIEFITNEFVEDAHRRGLKVYVWTVDDYDNIERMKNLNVDGMFSNYPDRL